MLKRFDYQTIILIVICTGILAVMFLLIGVVLYLYSKVAKALDAARIAKEADAGVSCIDPCKVTHENIIRAKPIPMESCRTLQCCDACSVYTDFGALPPCICSITEGL
ncbi:protein FAM24A [Arvicola amphibius]|uniref:protein FAM24A n=1 Tax=Arvicola amphibius TaxID=1047088 RepID=UPI0018E33AFD|nr:protein FAM24A [Arvicola amphibius]